MRHRDHEHDDAKYVVIEKGGTDLGTLLVGVLIGAGVALLFAPKSGPETRRAIKRGAQKSVDTVKNVATDMTDQVAETFETAKARVEEQIESVRSAVQTKKRQVTRAMDAGKEAAHQARGDLERRLAETKAAYNAGAEVARAGAASSGDDSV